MKLCFIATRFNKCLLFLSTQPRHLCGQTDTCNIQMNVSVVLQFCATCKTTQFGHRPAGNGGHVFREVMNHSSLSISVINGFGFGGCQENVSHLTAL